MQKMVFNHAKVFYLCNRLLWVFFSVKKPVLLVITQIHITKQPAFYLGIRKKLFVAQINFPRGTFILQINRHLIIAVFVARNRRNMIFVSTWNLLPLVE
jgi:hypothetical protein